MSRTPTEATFGKYIDAHTDALPALCIDLLEETEQKTGRAHWSIGKVEGRFLQMLIRLSGTRQAVEVGTFTGFSALMIAAALPSDGCLVTCEIDPQVAEIARRYFARSPHGHKIRLELGPAMATLQKIAPGDADFVFIDADKTLYNRYFDEAYRILRSGGLIFVDNVFWRRKVMRSRITNPNARVIAALNAKIAQDTRVEKVMLNLRDGVYLIRKK